MADEFAEHLLRSSLAHMCKQQGWHSATQSSLSVFASIARHYVHNLGTLTRNYSTLGGREEPNLDDLGQAMSELGLVLEDLQNLWSETDSSSGAPQVCDFPHSVTPLLNPASDSTASSDERPDYIPAHLPPLKEAIAVVPDTPVVENVSVTETSADASKADELFDEAAAAPAPSAPNFPFISVSTDDLPEPKFSSWGFQRINIAAPKNAPEDGNNSAEAQSTDTAEKKSPDNFAISENSDDFVFASKHSKSKERKHRKPSDTLPASPSSHTNDYPKKVEVPEPTPEPDKAADTSISDLSFLPSLGASTPLIKDDFLKKSKGDSKLNCKQKLFNEGYKHSDQITTIEEEIGGGYVPESKPVEEECLSPVRPKTPDINANSDSDNDFTKGFNNDFGFDDSSSEGFESKIAISVPSPLPPVASPVPKKVDNNHVVTENHGIPNHPSKKRRKLDKPLAQKNHEDHENSLLKNRIDLLNTDPLISKSKSPKSECKHINTSVVSDRPNHKSDKKHKNDLNHVSSKNDNHIKIKSNHDKTSKLEGDLKRKRHKKSKKKDRDRSLDHKKSSKSLFEDGIITHTDIKANLVTTQPDSEPLKVSLSIPVTKPVPTPKESKEERKTSAPPVDKLTNHVKEAPNHSPSIEPVPEKERSLEPLKLSLKKPIPPKAPVLDLRDDESELSSDTSLEGFEDLLPKPKKDSSNQSRRMVKTKAELKNHSSVSPLRVTTKEPKPDKPDKSDKADKKSKAFIPKIRINKGPPRDIIPVSPPPPPVKTTIKKMKLSSPTPPVDANVSTMSAISNQSLFIDESYMSQNTTVIEDKYDKPEKPFVPRIKIKLGQNSDDMSFVKSSPKHSNNDQAPVKGPNLKIKFNDISPYVPSPSTSEVKKKEKVVKIKKEKKKAVADPPLDTYSTHEDVYMSSQSLELESSVVSETVSLTTPIQPESVPAVQVWYCPACSLPDDGSPMVGCDKCDGWFHWPCVNMTAPPPDDQDWFCPTCVKKTQRGRKKKKKH